MNPPVDYSALYRSLFGRDIDPSGQAYWGEVAPGIIQNEGMVGLRNRMGAVASPADAAQYQRSQTAGLAPQTDADWTSYMARAGSQDRGINYMPGVYSDYGALAGAPASQVNAALFRTPDDLKAQIEAVMKLYSNIGGLGGLGGTDTNTSNRAPATQNEDKPSNRAPVWDAGGKRYV